MIYVFTQRMEVHAKSEDDARVKIMHGYAQVEEPVLENVRDE